MTRTDAIAIITAKLASLDDERVMTVANFVQSIDEAQQPLRKLTLRERALLEQSKEDFKAGHTYSNDEITTLLDERLALRGVPKSK